MRDPGFGYGTPLPAWLRKLAAALSIGLSAAAVVAIYVGSAVGILGTIGLLIYLAL